MVVWQRDILLPLLALPHFAASFAAPTSPLAAFPSDCDKEIAQGLWEDLMDEEPVLPVENIQGDCVLGFNKRFTQRLVLNLSCDSSNPQCISQVKTWLKDFATTGFGPTGSTVKITSLKEILSHRQERKDVLLGNAKSAREAVEKTVFSNICFSHQCLDVLLKGTAYETTMRQFDSTDPFAIGSWDRSPLLGDEKYRKDFAFGRDANNDFLINLGSDNEEAIKAAVATLTSSFKGLLNVVDDTLADRGVKDKDPLFGHEHFGFQDGLSQPSVRGTYLKGDGSKAFIVRRNVAPSKDDTRYKDYSRPGFRLCDAGHFVLGLDLLSAITDSSDPLMSNPHPDVYRQTEAPYPDWCAGGSFAVYRKIEQDVPSFWETCHNKAKEDLPQGSKEEQKTLAGKYASKMIGRWWDGSPLVLGKPMTGQYYPPTKDQWSSINSNQATAYDGLKNGFQFSAPEDPWKRIEGGDTPKYPADPNGSACPFAAHIRKVNPRDEFTDVGSDQRTLNHRILRRGNNYGSRVNDVFNPTQAEQNEPRGLSLVMYQADIENQFEFLQRHWGNSDTRPKPLGDDMVIGLPSKREKNINFDEDGNSVSISADAFTFPVGMGYFLLPPINAIMEVITADVEEGKINYSPPAGNVDFTDYQSKKQWDWTVDTVYWQSIWKSGDSTTIANGGQTAIPGYDKYPTGIAYRLPNPEDIARNYDKLQERTSLQFRSTTDIWKMAELLAQTKGKDAQAKDEIIPATIAWQGFPKRVLDLYRDSNVNPYEIVEEVGWPPKDLTYRSYATVNKARQMDEYCEWFTHRNDQGKITRVDITCESPEYWAFLVKNRPDVAVELYQKYVNPKVTLESLLDDDGNYDVYNEWNTEKGAMHLNCPPNSLFAEVYIAAEAATRWSSCNSEESCGGGSYCEPVLTGGGELVGCAQYGLSTRASDPTIGKNVNDLIRNGLIISVADPVGLYLEKLDTTGWLKPDATPFAEDEIKEVVKYARESPDGKMKLRIQVEIPEDRGYVLGDCSIGGAPLDWAGQLVDASVTVFLNAVALNGKDDALPFLLSEEEMEQTAVPCRKLWGTQAESGQDLGPTENLINAMVPAPEAPSKGE